MFGLLVGALLLSNSLALDTTTSSPISTSSATPVATSSGEVLSKTSVRDNLQDAVEIRHAKIQEIRDGIKEEVDKKLAAFKKKLPAVKDAVQSEALEGLVSKFDSLNVKWVDSWKDALDRLSKILDKMDTSAAKLKTAGKDISAYETSAKTARAKIADAQSVLEEQAGNYYIFSIASVSGVGTEVKDLSTLFKKDIQSTQKSVRAAKEAVKVAFNEFKALNQIDILK